MIKLVFGDACTRVWQATRAPAPRATGVTLALAVGIVACGGASGGDKADLSDNERDVEIHHEACNGDSGSAKKVDVNGDGKPDITHVMDGARESCRIVDLNFDGRVDAFIYFDGTGKERRRESDFDRDGRPDEIDTLQAGVLVRKERETNFDGKIDTWDTYVSAKLVKRERDSDADAIVDQWWEFNGDDPKCALVSSDKNTDGKPDPDTVVDLCADPNAPVKPATPPPPPTSSSTIPSAAASPPAAPAPSSAPSSGAPAPSGSATPASGSATPPKPPPAPSGSAATPPKKP